MKHDKFIMRLVRAAFTASLILPLAGLCMRLTLGGEDIVSRAISKAGESIFDNFDLILAVILASSLSVRSRVTAPISAVAAFLTCNSVYSIMDPAIDTGILLGLLFGLTSAFVHNLSDKYVPYSERGFVTFERFSPLAMAMFGIIVGAIVGLLWPAIQAQLSYLSVQIVNNESIGPFLFGFANRIFIITGLHHVLNSHVWLETGTYITTINGETKELHGDMVRFIAGDPSAGIYETGFYLVMLFGIPAILLALYHQASKVSLGAKITDLSLLRKSLIATAISSILLGVTEPIEYILFIVAFRFFLIHAFLTGVALTICQYLDIHHGFAFSAGLIDFFAFLDISTHTILLLPLGLIFAFIYYYLTCWYITKYRFRGANFLFENQNKKI